MKMIIQPDNNCLVYSAAMVLEVDPKDIFKHIGHHGQRIVWPNLTGNARLIGVHIQEINYFAISLGYCFTLVEPAPQSQPIGVDIKSEKIYDQDDGEAKFFNTIRGRSAIIIGQNLNGNGHAMAWDGNKIYDPNGILCGLFDCGIKEAWILSKMI